MGRGFERADISRRRFVGATAGAALARRALAAAGAPAPYGALPSERQVRWHEMGFYGFLHFSINTFTDKEWGYGDEDPSLFDPSAFDADAMVRMLQAAGMAGVILTCKHHDGFCLWPTRTTARSVRSSPWRGGNGDVVREVSEAARRHGLRFGVYLSPWDRSHPQYGKPEYIGVYREQLRELLTEYGPIFEVWHDGANGGDGYYGGTREKRTIDKRTYYDWPATWELVRRLQPGAVIFSDVGPDIRWVGNERGEAAETCWETYDPVAEGGGPASPGDVRAKESETGTRHGMRWLPPECDVSIRPGWFWHEREDSRVKTPAQLLQLYLRSAGRGGSLLLNVPPDRRGLIADADAASLRDFGTQLRATFARNLTAGARGSASHVRGNDRRFGPASLVDGDPYSYWSTDDSITEADAVLDLGQSVSFNLVRVRENIRLGQRVDAFAVDMEQNGAWTTVAAGTSIGCCRLIPTPREVKARRIRLRITQAAACPAVSELALFYCTAVG